MPLFRSLPSSFQSRRPKGAAASWVPRTAALLLLMMPAAHGIQLSAPASVPANASDVLDQAFLSFAIEGRDFLDYTGTDAEPNEFTANMLSTFANKTGTPPYLRIGGTTQDHFHYDAAQAEAIRYDNPDLPTWGNLFANITVGRAWFEGFHQLASGDAVVWDLQVFLARKNLSNAVEFVRAGAEAVGGAANLHALEIGNEPDLYNSSGFLAGQTDRPAAYGPARYVAEFAEVAAAVARGVELGPGPRFQALALSSLVTDPWSEENAFDAGLSPDLVQSVSEHYYQLTSGQGLEAGLMNKAAIRSKTDSRFKDHIAYVKREHPGIAFLIAEAASALANGNDFDLAASLGTALWTVDWLLHVATLGVTRVNMQLGSRYPFSPWFGSTTTVGNSTLARQTLGSFYGNVFVADFIGTAGELQVAELDTGDANLTAYAGYHAGTRSKIAIVNLELWRETSGTARPNKTLEITDLAGSSSVRVQRLTAARGGAGALAADVTWAGTQWTAESGGVPVVVVPDDDYTVAVDEAGSVQVTCQASEALLVSVIAGN